MIVSVQLRPTAAEKSGKLSLVPVLKSGEVPIMAASDEVVHLPTWPINPAAYERLYAFNGNCDDYLDTDADWEEIRIRPGLTEEEIYRRLPCAPDFEYGGYLTKSRIRFIKCDPTRSNTLMSKICTFHSHPTDHAAADVPSASDIFQFLSFRHVRAIMVGSTRIWVLDKTKATLGTVKRLGIWTEENLCTEVGRLEKKFPYNWHDPFMILALKQLGLDWPKSLKELESDLENLLRTILKIKVRVFSCVAGERAR